ncbi:MAG: hypothetical protein ACI822_001205, partial [Gammaproteobacteria bacterium]
MSGKTKPNTPLLFHQLVCSSSISIC